MGWSAAPLALVAKSVTPHVSVDDTGVDYLIILIYFAFILAVGLALRRKMRSSEDFFLSGRALPSWITGLAFMAANLGALEVMGMGAGAAQYGIMMAHFYWIGAIPAMLFVGLMMMPFYYNSKTHSVPGFLKLRYNEATRGFNAVCFLLLTLLMGGINTYAMAIIIQLLLNIDFNVSLWIASGIVTFYIVIGGLSSAIYNEVLQLFLMFLGLIPLAALGFIAVGGVSSLAHATHQGQQFVHLWQFTGTTNNPMAVNWWGLVFGLGWVLSFGYWCTDYLVVQRALAAESEVAARRTPIIASFPKVVFPFLAIFPGLVVLTFLPKLGTTNSIANSYNMAIPYAMAHYFPSGLLGLGLVAMIASFMSGQAGNVSAFNTVWTYDIYRTYLNREASDRHLVWMGRVVTVVGVLISVGTAYWVKSFLSIMDYVQIIFSIVNAPLFGTMLLGMFWKRATPLGGLVGIVAGTVGAIVLFLIDVANQGLTIAEGLGPTFYRALWAWCITVGLNVFVSLITKPKSEEELQGLTWFTTSTERQTEPKWYKRPAILAVVSLAIVVALNVIYA